MGDVLPDPRQRPTLKIPEAGAILGWSRSKSFANKHAFPLIEVSPHRFEVPTALWLRQLGQLTDGPDASSVDVDALAEAVAERLMARLFAAFRQGVGPVATGPDAAIDERGADPRRGSPYIRPVS